MRVAVIGAGIIGVTTAYELASDRHEVVVFEQHGSVAAAASFANAGVVAPGYVTPWGANVLPAKFLLQMFRRHAPLRLNAPLDAASAKWLWKCWRAASRQPDARHRDSLQRLASLSRQRLNDITRSLQLDYERCEGFLVLLRTPQDLTLAQPRIDMLNQLGIKHSMLDARGCTIVEPGLNQDMPLHAGIYLPDGEIANCRQFAHLLRSEAQALGVRFRFHTEVQRIIPGARPELIHQATSSEDSDAPVTMMELRRDEIPTLPMTPEPTSDIFDAIVVCAAHGSTALLSRHGLKLPLAPLYGYSVTAPIRQHESHPDRGPRAGVLDEHYRIGISRFGTRLRVAGGAELGGTLAKHDKGILDTLYKVLHDWYPGAARLTHAQRWKGARPMLPDGSPVLGRSGIEGVWLNLGHGASGWALACGSARVVADMLSARSPSMDAQGFDVERLRR